MAAVALAVRWALEARSQHPALADGACQQLAPRGHNRHTTIFIDPGHGGPDPGTQGVISGGRPVYEKDLTLATARTLTDLLRADGYTVVLSRTRDSSVARLSAAAAPGGVYSVAGDHADLEARVACANAAHAQLLVSLHFNGFSNPAVGGAETFYDDARPFSAQNLRLAQLVQSGVASQLAVAGWQVDDRGAIADSTDIAPTLSDAAAAYPHLLLLGPAQAGYFAHPSAMPGVLCEPLFLTNPEEAAIAASARGQTAIAQGIAHGIEQYLQQGGA